MKTVGLDRLHVDPTRKSKRGTRMVRYVPVSVGSGLLFGVLDGLIHGNPLARKLFGAYGPIARTSINVPAGLAIDLVYGFVMAGVFLLLYPSLPGQTGPVKGLSFALLVWFFRVLMDVASQWMTLNVPPGTLLYVLATGLAEMLALGILYGLTLKPSS
jgi:hypothetical protein